ncbi:Casparian strip membrane protein [Sesbania bispinosa]|nr:Casparian strip membrane protein [Sesbania bispinosa]
MDGQGKAIINGNGDEINGRELASPKRAPGGGACDLLLRFVALLLTLAAAIVVGADKQTKVVPFKVIDTLPPLNVPVTAKWHYLSAFVYFMVANAIASTYGALSLFLGLINRGKSKGLWRLMIIIDALMVALLFSGNGAATAVGVIGFQGNSHVQWNKVCNVFDKFCHQVAASIILSLLGSVAFLFLVMIPLLRLHPRA